MRLRHGAALVSIRNKRLLYQENTHSIYLYVKTDYYELQTDCFKQLTGCFVRYRLPGSPDTNIGSYVQGHNAGYRFSNAYWC